MLCKKPYMLGVTPCGCGQCLPCRINRRRLWTHRMLLESAKNVGSCFVTLTYSQEKLPRGASLVPHDLQAWLKRLRFAVAPDRLRFFAVGEYGDQSWRPHYHAAIFGLDALRGGGEDGGSGVVAQTWGQGHTFVGELTPESSAYVGGYVTKKLTKEGDARLQGRYPEFARMSLRPGIGAGAVVDVAKVLASGVGKDFVEAMGDVPHALDRGGKSMPLGRYLRRKLREALGRAPDTPASEARRYALELRVLLEDYSKTSPLANRSLSKVFVDMNWQKILNFEARFKLWEAARGL